LPIMVVSKYDMLTLPLAVHLRIEEINRKLRTGDVIPNERDR
jgi:hypothetical protein